MWKTDGCLENDCRGQSRPDLAWEPSANGPRPGDRLLSFDEDIEF
jgi:hypothetical protein